MPYQSQSEIAAFYVGVIRSVASRPSVGVSEWEFKSAIELRQDIELLKPAISALLTQFLEAYQDWYDSHVEIEKAGLSGSLPPHLSAALTASIIARDSTRAKLLAAL